VLSVALPAAKAIADIELTESQWKKLETEIDGAKDGLSALVGSLADGLTGVVNEDDNPVSPNRSREVAGAIGGNLA